MTRPTPVRVFAPIVLRRAALLALLPLAGACASATRARCAQPEFLYTERVAGRGDRMEERPVYACVDADSTRAAAKATAAVE